ncbi:3'-5' exonuclease [Devosia sp. XK-2]|uniref:3'-5' exonuclease n=1 Tax=Devosia sp. XK-2 TaxID=3126689 RepID=UPI0030D18A06
MASAVIFDCEFLCLEGSQRRFWCAAHDPDPIVAQIGAVRLGLEGDIPILGTFRAYVRPVDRFGNRYVIDQFFTKLTGIADADIDDKGIPLQEALLAFDQFSSGDLCWSWGKDELNMLAISCFVAGIAPPIPATRFDNAVKLLLAAGMPVDDLARTPSNEHSNYYGIEHPPLRGHDALDDALSVSYALQHLMRAGKLNPHVLAR